jgi:hypothetical protein
MFNPLAIFSPEALDGFVEKGMRFFVRQDFPRGRRPLEERIKGSFLFSHYENYFRAKEHFDVLAEDPFRFLYEWENPAHREKLRVAASQPEAYRIFANAFVPNWEDHLTDPLREKIRAYVNRLGWKPSRSEGIEPQFYPHFGEMHVCLKFRGREVRVNFAEIENLH